jgi:hypothetical protein
MSTPFFTKNRLGYYPLKYSKSSINLDFLHFIYDNVESENIYECYVRPGMEVI